MTRASWTKDMLRMLREWWPSCMGGAEHGSVLVELADQEEQ